MARHLVPVLRRRPQSSCRSARPQAAKPWPPVSRTAVGDLDLRQERVTKVSSRVVVVLVAAFILASSTVAWAKGGGHSSGGHSSFSAGSHSSSHSSSTFSSGSHSSSSSSTSHSSGTGSHSGASVHVHGYTRKDGTYVAPYTRHEPGGGHSTTSTHASSPWHPPSSLGTSEATSSHSHGHAKRSETERHAFMHTHPCPSTVKTSGACPGYVVDHITPLKRGGADLPSNMQWQTVQQGKAKDKWE